MNKSNLNFEKWSTIFLCSWGGYRGNVLVLFKIIQQIQKKNFQTIIIYIDVMRIGKVFEG